MLLRALGFTSNTDIFNAFGLIKEVDFSKDKSIINNYIGATITEDVVDTKTGEIFFESGVELTVENTADLIESGIGSVNLVDSNKDFHSMLLLNTIERIPPRALRKPLLWFINCYEQVSLQIWKQLKSSLREYFSAPRNMI